MGNLRKDDGVFNNNKKRTFSAYNARPAGLVGFFILTIVFDIPHETTMLND